MHQVSMGKELRRAEAESDKPDEFLKQELDYILKTYGGEKVDWDRWSGALERTSQYTDEQLFAFFRQASSSPWRYDIKTRGESDVDLTRISANETWGDFFRRVAARVLQYELMITDMSKCPSNGNGSNGSKP